MSKLLHTRLENRILICREYAQLWQIFFYAFADDMEEKVISPQMEAEFENLLNILALNHFKFIELCGEHMKDSGDVIKVIAEAPSLGQIKEMQEATRSKLLVRSHTAFIDMNRALGKMLASLPPKQLAAMQAADAAAQQQGAA